MSVTTEPRTSGKNLAFAVAGDITKEDYDVLMPVVAQAIDEHGSVNLLLDLTDFRWEKVSAWGADLEFGHRYHEKIERMALVGNKAWERHLAHICAPFYTKQAAYFEDADAAWAWLTAP